MTAGERDSRVQQAQASVGSASSRFCQSWSGGTPADARGGTCTADKNAKLNMLRLQELGFLLAACPTDPAREKKSSLNPLALTFMS